MEPIKRFELWYGNTGLLDELKNTKPEDGQVLIDLFMYVDGKVIDETSMAINKDAVGKTVIFPFGRVLVTGSGYQANDIVKITNEVAEIPVERPEYRAAVQWNQANPQAQDQKDTGPRYEGEANIVRLLKLHNFDPRPFRKKLEPNYKICIPKHYIECKMDVELMLK